MNLRVALLAGAAFAMAGCGAPVVLAAGAPATPDDPARVPLEGTLRLGPALASPVDVHRDDFRLFGQPAAELELPPLTATFVSDGTVLLPLERLPIPGEGGYDYVLLPGRNWHDASAGVDRAVVPFALLEKNANCLHYGSLDFGYDADGARGAASYHIAAETCRYLKFDATGDRAIEYRPEPVPGRHEALAAYAAERRARLPRRPIKRLAADYPGSDPGAFGNAAEVDPRDMTAYGFVIDGVHYAGGCTSRAGPLPFCAELPLPSYSLAKSLVAGLALMRAERLFPGTRRRQVTDLVPACAAAGGWDGVTLEHLLDMATGRYDETGYQADEDALLASEFFVATDHATKLAFACRRWPRRAEPGERWVYHTTDTYILGVALNSVVHEEFGPDAELFDDLVAGPVFDALRLGPLTRFTRRTLDSERQAFTGWGLVLLADDIARLAAFLGPATIDGQPLLDDAMAEAALRREGQDAGLPTGVPGLTYDNGFWAYDVGPHLGCGGPLPVPLMSGYGGIIVTLFPNGSSYYYVSDGGTHRWLSAARAAHAIRPMCRSGDTDDTDDDRSSR